MGYEPITAVGIDVSKNKSMIAACRPGGEVNAGFFVSVINAMLIHHFSNNSLRKVKPTKPIHLKLPITLYHTC